MLLIVKTGALLYSDTSLTIIHRPVTTLTDIKTSLWTNVISVFDLTRRRTGGCTFGELLSFWTGNSYEFQIQNQINLCSVYVVGTRVHYDTDRWSEKPRRSVVKEAPSQLASLCLCHHQQVTFTIAPAPMYQRLSSGPVYPSQANHTMNTFIVIFHRQRQYQRT